MLALLLIPDGRQKQDREAPNDVLHIEVYVPPAVEPVVFKMLCGREARELPSGDLSPPIDFYLFEHGHKATCRKCRAAAGLPPL